MPDGDICILAALVGTTRRRRCTAPPEPFSSAGMHCAHHLLNFTQENHVCGSMRLLNSQPTSQRIPYLSPAPRPLTGWACGLARPALSRCAAVTGAKSSETQGLRGPRRTQHDERKTSFAMLPRSRGVSAELLLRPKCSEQLVGRMGWVVGPARGFTEFHHVRATQKIIHASTHNASKKPCPPTGTYVRATYTGKKEKVRRGFEQFTAFHRSPFVYK